MHESVPVLGLYVEDLHLGGNLAQHRRPSQSPCERDLRRGERELERALRQLARGDDPAKVLEALSQGLVNKLMHAPTQALTETAGDERQELARTLARLFRIE